jgi:glycosyltransferase involved in cell wall biosynthesis
LRIKDRHVVESMILKKERVRILFTITAYPPSTGGAQLHAHQTARRLQHNHDVSVVAFWKKNRTDWLLGTTIRAPSNSEFYTIDGIHVTGLSLTASQKLSLTPHALAYYAFQKTAIRHISKYLAEQIEAAAEKCDLVHNHRIGREPLSYASYDTARRKNIPFFLTPYHHPRWKGWLYREYHKLYRLSDGVFALTESEKEILIGLGVAQERIFVVGGGPVLAESSRPGLFRERHDLNGRPMVLFVGQKYEYKGLVSLLRAAEITSQQYPDVVFVFLGPRTDFSRKLFSTVHTQNVLEIGEVDLQEKTDALAACDIFCLPSTQESLGMVFLEAWMMKKPVIGGDIPAVREIISDGQDGYLVKDDPTQIAERTIHLLNNPTARVNMGRKGNEKTLANYSWERVAEKTEAAYRKIVG